MAASEKLTLENFRDLSLKDLEEVTYALQIEYDPPLTEEQRPKVLNYIEYIIRNHDEYDEEVLIEERQGRRLSLGRSCDDKNTAIMQKDTGLMSDAQLVFLPQIEITRDKDGTVIDKKIKYFCLDRYDDLPIAIDQKINPLNDAPLTDIQLQFLIEQRDNNPYPNISVSEFLDEIEERIGDYKPPDIPRYVLLSDKLEKLLKSQVGDFLVYDLNLIPKFASELTAKQYKRFMKFYKVKIVSEDRNDASVETLQSLINLYNLKNDYQTAALITMTIGDYIYMIDKGITYQELIQDEGRPDVQWNPDDVEISYYDNGQLRYTVRLNENEKRDGVWEAYYKDGDLKSKGEYKNGEKEGVWEAYYKDGDLKSKGEYKNGEKEGVWEGYYKNKQLMRKGEYKNGKEEGVWEQYYENRQLELKGEYKNGKEEGVWEEYTWDGQLMRKEEYKNGKRV